MGRIPVNKKYRKFEEPATHRKFYVPLFRGQNVLVTRFPPTPWLYTTAREAQEHAERNEIKKRAQNKRFESDPDYRGEVMTRYANKIKVWTMEQEEAKKLAEEDTEPEKEENE
jgi:hypothetical protein